MLLTLLYFLAYVPFAMLTKAVSSWHILTISTFSCFLSMLLIWSGITIYARWKHKPSLDFWGHFRFNYTTLFSACMSAAIILSSTTIYSLPVSLLAVILLMKGGVFPQAPILDLIAKRKITPRAWAVLLLSLSAIFLICFKQTSTKSADAPIGVKIAALGLVLVYLGAYAVKLRIMDPYKHFDKSRSRSAQDRAVLSFFVTEQCLATLIALTVVLLFQHNWQPALTWKPWAIGLASQCTGLFGGLILLRRDLHSITVPLNRSTSVQAGVAASVLLGKHIEPYEWIGVALIMCTVIISSMKEKA